MMEEILANRFQPGLDQSTVSRMIQAVLDFYPHWMDHPAELVFKELVQGERISNAGLAQDKANRMREALSNPDTVLPSLSRWAPARYEEKKQRLIARKRHQKIIRAWFQKTAPELMSPLDLATFAKNGSSFLAMIVSMADWKKSALEAYLAQVWKRWHPAEMAEIDAACASLDCKLLLKLPVTHSYLLAELLYDVGPITKIGPPGSEKSNPQVLSGRQINNEEDQEYVTSALQCDRLLTCDEGMHRIAEAFRQVGHWKGASIYIPPDKADQLDQFFV